MMLKKIAEVVWVGIIGFILYCMRYNETDKVVLTNSSWETTRVHWVCAGYAHHPEWETQYDGRYEMGEEFAIEDFYDSFYRNSADETMRNIWYINDELKLKNGQFVVDLPLEERDEDCVFVLNDGYITKLNELFENLKLRDGKDVYINLH